MHKFLIYESILYDSKTIVTVCYRTVYDITIVIVSIVYLIYFTIIVIIIQIHNTQCYTL